MSLERMERTFALQLVLDELDCSILVQALETLAEFSRKDEGQTYAGLDPSFVNFRCGKIIDLINGTFEGYKQERGI